MITKKPKFNVNTKFTGLIKQTKFSFSELKNEMNENNSSEKKDNNLLEDEKEIQDVPQNYNVNIKKKENLRILKDYFYEGNIDRTKVLPKKNQEEINLLNIPEYRELYKNFSLVIREDQYHEIDNIKHDVVENDKRYKYGLMAKNEMPFQEIVVFNKEDEVEKTATENLFEILGMDKESSYESMVLKFRTEYQHGNSI